MAGRELISYLYVMFIATTQERRRPPARGPLLLASLLAGVGLFLAGALLAPASVSAQDGRSPAGNGGAGAATATRDAGADTVELDPIARLQIALDAGEITLAHDTVWGYLPSLLEALDIPVSSQGLVFSRTSLQTDRIAPWAPRALYFNDDVYVGWVQESNIVEIASVDPDDGAIFYTLPQDPEGPPTFERESTTCHMCHASSITNGVPGFMLLSVLADRSGYPVTEIHEDATTDRTPMSERWGGWYVTGTSGDVTHAGNQRSEKLLHEIANERRSVQEMDLSEGTNVTDLSDHFYTDAYLSDDSDIVALMVLAHQAHVHNLMAVAQRQTAEALKDQQAVLRTTGEDPPPSGYLPITKVRIETVTERLLEGMLFMGEANLGSPVRGTSGFAEEFAARGPFDTQGRTLRAFDLETRLFRYPMSFLVYSDAFRTLPEPVKETLYRRLWEVLTGQDESGKFHHLDAEQRSAIMEILTETVPEFGSRVATESFDPI